MTTPATITAPAWALAALRAAADADRDAAAQEAQRERERVVARDAAVWRALKIAAGIALNRVVGVTVVDVPRESFANTVAADVTLDGFTFRVTYGAATWANAATASVTDCADDDGLLLVCLLVGDGEASPFLASPVQLGQFLRGFYRLEGDAPPPPTCPECGDPRKAHGPGCVGSSDYGSDAHLRPAPYPPNPVDG